MITEGQAHNGRSGRELYPTVSSFDTLDSPGPQPEWTPSAPNYSSGTQLRSLNHSMPDRQQKLTAFAMTITMSCLRTP